MLGEKWAIEHTTLKNKLISSGTGPISRTACPKWLRIPIPAPSTKGILILASQIEKIGFFHSFPSIMKWKVLWHITINAESHNDYFMGWKTQMNTSIVVTLCYSLTTHHTSPLLLVQHLSFLLRTQFSPALSRGGLCNLEMASVMYPPSQWFFNHGYNIQPGPERERAHWWGPFCRWTCTYRDVG